MEKKIDFDANEGDVVGVEYFNRGEPLSEIWTFVNFNPHTKNLYLKGGNSFIRISEAKIISFKKFTKGEYDSLMESGLLATK